MDVRFEQMQGSKGPMANDFNIRFDGEVVGVYHKNRHARPGTDSATVRSLDGRVAIVPNESAAVAWILKKAEQALEDGPVAVSAHQEPPAAA